MDSPRREIQNHCEFLDPDNSRPLRFFHRAHLTRCRRQRETKSVRKLSLKKIQSEVYESHRPAGGIRAAVTGQKAAPTGGRSGL
jgi:hypothetical protein